MGAEREEALRLARDCARTYGPEQTEGSLARALLALEAELEAAQHERSVATSWAAELAGEKRALQASVEIIQRERDELRSFLVDVTWHEDIEGNSELRAEDFEKLRQLLYGEVRHGR